MPKIYMNEWPPGSPEQEEKANNVRLAARLMINAALSSPSPGGTPQIEAHLAYGREEMNELARTRTGEFSEVKSQPEVLATKRRVSGHFCGLDDARAIARSTGPR